MRVIKIRKATTRDKADRKGGGAVVTLGNHETCLTQGEFNKLLTRLNAVSQSLKKIPSFERHSFVKSDLIPLTGSVEVHKLNEKIFSDDDCSLLEEYINEQKNICHYCNTLDGSLSIGLNMVNGCHVSADDEMINIILTALNKL